MGFWRRLASARVLLVFLSLIQFVILARAHIIPLGTRVWRLRSESALERSARLAFGEDFAAYVQFLRETVPADGKVIIPPLPMDPVYGNIGLVQYYLFPRRVDNCGENEIEACLLRVTGPRTYLLSLPVFPPRELAEKSKVLVEFDAERGVYMPKPVGDGEVVP